MLPEVTQRTVLAPSTETDKPKQNSADPDKTPPNAASDLGPHCLSLMQQVLDKSIAGKMDVFSNFMRCLVQN